MFSKDALNRMTPEQRRHVAMLGVQARELKRLSQEPYEYLPIRQGLQLACITIDLRTSVARANHILLFDVGYDNRYLWMLNNKVQDELLGWTPAMRRLERQVRPLSGIE